MVELYPLLLARVHITAALRDEKVIYFIDNDPARDGLICGASSSDWSQLIIEQFYAEETNSPSFSWFARIPSFSNPADLPSRGGVDEAAVSLNADIFTCELHSSIISRLTAV